MRDDDLAAYCFPRSPTSTPPPTNTPRPTLPPSPTLTTVPIQFTPTPAPTDPPTLPPLSSPTIEIFTPAPAGECYRVTAPLGVKLREEAGTFSKEVGGVSIGDIVQVTDPPASANGYTWRKIENLIWPNRSWFVGGWAAFGSGWFTPSICAGPSGSNAPQSVAYSGGGHAIPTTATPLYYSTPALVPPAP